METLSLLIKPASGNCNMRCRYCFYADVVSARETPNRGVMTPETLETLVRRAFEEATALVSFGFQGGEPMLAGLDFFRMLMALEKRYNARGIQVMNAIQTNGTLIDAEWARFFAENRFLVGLSIDGSRQTHDALRMDARGDDTHARCLKAAKLLTDAGAEFNILSVVTKNFALHPEKAYQFYKKNGFRYVQLIPCLDELGEEPGSHPYSLDAARYGRFLCRFFDLWYDDFIRDDYTSVRMFDNYVRMLMGEPPENCGMAGQCQGYPVIEADGTVYPCDFYVLDEYMLGNVRENTFSDMLSGKVAERFMAPSRAARDECRACPYGFICRGGCRRDREPTEGGALSLNRYCEAYKEFFAHALPRMAEIARRMGQR